ncbi:MAG: SdrD B-like domain-containing protein, partial [Chitinophagales bacterium]
VLIGGEHNPTIDAGYFAPASIGDYVWLDEDGDGEQDDNEVGLEGITVILYTETGEEIGTTVTDEDGQYIFDGLVPNTYIISTPFEEILEQYNLVPSTPSSSSISVISGDANMGGDFGYEVLPPELGTITGTLFFDEDQNDLFETNEGVVSGATVSLYDENGVLVATTTTDPNGDYIFTNLPEGDYILEVEPVLVTGETIGTFDQTALSLGEGTNLNDVNFGYDPLPTGTISGTSWIDENNDGEQSEEEVPVEGIVVSLIDENGIVISTAITDENGEYTFENVPTGDYTVVMPSTTESGEVIGSNTNTNVSITEDNLDEIVDAPYLPLSNIAGTVWEDTDGDGIQDPDEMSITGVEVILTLPDGSIISQLTDANGNYDFGDLPSGNYNITVVPSNGVELSTPNTYTINLNANDTDDTADFGFLPQLYSIGNSVWYDLDGNGIQDDGEPGIPDVVITVINEDGQSFTTGTDVTGHYSITDLPVGNYQVLVGNEPLGAMPTTPTSYEVTLGTEDYNDADFGFTPDQSRLGFIEGQVWFDIDFDQEMEPGEDGISMIEVSLNDAMGNPLLTTLTDNTGAYSFPEMPAGFYTVSINATTIPDGLSPSTPDSYAVVLLEGQINNTANFGLGITGGGIPSDICVEMSESTDICFELNEGEFINLSGSSSNVAGDLAFATETCIAYTPANSFEGMEIVTIVICQTENPDNCYEDIYTLNVGCMAPTAMTDYISISPEGVTLNGNPNDDANGYDGVNLDTRANDSSECYEMTSSTVVGEPTNGSATMVDFSNGIVNYIPNEGFEGLDTITYQVCNECGACDIAQVIIDVSLAPEEEECEPFETTICAEPLQPVEVCPDFCLEEDYAITESNTTFNCSLTNNGDCLTYTALPAFIGTDVIEIVACLISDATVCDTAYVNVNVVMDCDEVPNNLPVASDDSTTSDNGAPVMIDAIGNDSDPDNDLLSITSYEQPSNGTVTMVDGLIMYTPNEGFEGMDSFTYQVCDEYGGCDEATISIITTLETPCSDTIELCTGPVSPVTVCPEFCNLPSGAAYTITSAHTTFNCSLEVMDNNCIEYTALPLFVGVETIVVTACTVEGICDTSYVIVTVSDDCGAIGIGTGLAGGIDVEDAFVPSAGKTTDTNVIDTDEVTSKVSNQFVINNIVPNPAKDFISITYTSTLAGAVQLQVYDLTGRLLTVQQLDSIEGVNAQRIEVGDYPQGIYTLVLKMGETVVNTKFVKQ